jgi:predicted MFS family arabinose efflux permease
MGLACTEDTPATAPTPGSCPAPTLVGQPVVEARPDLGPGRTGIREVRPDAVSIRTWLAVFSLALGAAMIVTSEFIPVGFLPNVADDLHVSLGLAGLMVLVPGLTAAVAAPVAIVAAGDLDRRLMIVLLGLLVVVSNALAAAAPTFAVVLVARVFLGIAIGGFWAVVPPLGFRLVGPEAGTRATSIILSGLSAGTVVGLPAGQLFGNLIGWRATFAVAAVAAFGFAATQLVLLPRIPSNGNMRFRHLTRVLHVPIARTTLVAGAVVTIGQFSASTFLTPFLRDEADMGSHLVTALFLGYGLAGIAGTLLGSALVARSRIWTLVGASSAFGAIVLILPSVTAAPFVVGAMLVAWGLIWGLVPLSLQTLMLTATPETPEASAAVLMSLLQLAIAVGSALGGLLVDFSGLDAVYVVGGATAIVAGFVALVGRHGV